MRRFNLLPFFCLVTVVAISLPAFSGCDLGTYSQRSTEYLQKNPGGMRKKTVKPKEVEEEEARAVRRNDLMWDRLPACQYALDRLEAYPTHVTRRNRCIA